MTDYPVAMINAEFFDSSSTGGFPDGGTWTVDGDDSTMLFDFDPASAAEVAAETGIVGWRLDITVSSVTDFVKLYYNVAFDEEGAGYTAYGPEDNSLNSVFNISAPGDYSVDVTNMYYFGFYATTPYEVLDRMTSTSGDYNHGYGELEVWYGNTGSAVLTKAEWVFYTEIEEPSKLRRTRRNFMSRD